MLQATSPYKSIPLPDVLLDHQKKSSSPYLPPQPLLKAPPPTKPPFKGKPLPQTSYEKLPIPKTDLPLPHKTTTFSPPLPAKISKVAPQKTASPVPPLAENPALTLPESIASPPKLPAPPPPAKVLLHSIIPKVPLTKPQPLAQTLYSHFSENQNNSNKNIMGVFNRKSHTIAFALCLVALFCFNASSIFAATNKQPVPISKLEQKQLIKAGIISEAFSKKKRLLSHKVKRGETLLAISIRYKIKMKNIIRKRGMYGELKTGETLYLPFARMEKSTKKAPAKKSSSGGKTVISQPSKKPQKANSKKSVLLPPEKSSTDWEKIRLQQQQRYAQLLRLREAEAIATNNLNFSLPSDLALARAYGVYNGVFHHGNSYSSRTPTPVHASEIGQVLTVGKMRGMGNTVLIKHPGGFISIVSGLVSVKVASGDFVRRGQILGQSREWLTYTLTFAGNPVNPNAKHVAMQNSVAKVDSSRADFPRSTDATNAASPFGEPAISARNSTSILTTKKDLNIENSGVFPLAIPKASQFGEPAPVGNTPLGNIVQHR